MFNIFRRMEQDIEIDIDKHRPGLALAVLFPIASSFLLTFAVSRIFNKLFPWFYLQVHSGLHIHHYTYGVFILAISSYLALIYNGPKATYLISLLMGVGLGLAFDEFGLWLHLRSDDSSRWSYDGFLIIMAIFVITVSAEYSILYFKRHHVLSQNAKKSLK